MSKSWRIETADVSIWTRRMQARVDVDWQASSKPSQIVPADQTASLTRMSPVSNLFRVPSWVADGGTAAVGMRKGATLTVTVPGGVPETVNRWRTFDVVAVPGQNVETMKCDV